MNNIPKKVAFHNLGCKVNAYETDAMVQAFVQAGFTEVPFEETADIYIVNTCSVTNIADRKSRQMLHRAKKTNPQGFVVAVGCYVQSAHEEVLKDASVDFAVGNNRKGDIVSTVLKAYEERAINPEQDEEIWEDIVEIDKEQEFDSQFLTKIDSHTRAFIKVQDGCNQFCSYCIIPYTRGRIRSRHPEDVIKEIRELTSNGICEVVLTGIHLSSYGLDYAKRELEETVFISGRKKALKELRLLDLIAMVSELEGVKRIRLGSLEPRIVTEEFAKELAGFPKVCPHFHLSLQSGCDATLKRMNRKYDTREYKASCDILRHNFTEPAITTDVIVGFPGETEEEFDKTQEYLSDLRLYEMHIFKYSVRKGTRAATMPDQVPEPVKAQRSDVLLDMEAKLSENYRESFLRAEKLAVLLEEETNIQGEKYLVGYTERYVRVAIPSDESSRTLLNQIVEVYPERMLTSEILLGQKA